MSTVAHPSAPDGTGVHVIFFRDDDDDLAYAAAVAAAGHTSAYLPVLDVAPLAAALPALDAALSRTPPPRCIAVTSRHAAAILREACLRLHAGHGAAACAALRGTPLLAVGGRTARALGGAPCLGAAVGCGSGSAAGLAPLVVASCGVVVGDGGGSNGGGAVAPVLFVCGEGRLEALPAAMRAAGVPLLEVAVYRSAAAPEEALRERWGRAAGEGALTARRRCCCVLFSPSGVAAAAGAGLLRPAPGLLLLAIGATTAAALRAAGLPCHGVAATPTAEGVAGALGAALAAR
jgi:uroporphyrinogen-III synthase